MAVMAGSDIRIDETGSLILHAKRKITSEDARRAAMTGATIQPGALVAAMEALSAAYLEQGWRFGCEISRSHHAYDLTVSVDIGASLRSALRWAEQEGDVDKVKALLHNIGEHLASICPAAADELMAWSAMPEPPSKFNPEGSAK